MRPLLAAPLLFVFACAEPNTFSLRSPEARVDVTVEPFGFVVRSAAGEAVLTSLPGGGFAPTRDRPTYIDQIVPGWDGYQAGDGVLSVNCFSPLATTRIPDPG